MIRTAVFHELVKGALHPKETVVLAEVFAALEHDEALGHARLAGAWAARAVPALVGHGVEVSRESVSEDHEVSPPRSPATRPDPGKLLRYAEIASQAGIEALRETPDEAIVQHTQAACVDALLTPKLPLSEIPEPVVQMVKAMALYASGASFSQLGRWVGGKAKSTIYTWVIGLALALWPVIRGWVWSHVTGSRQYIDEKWIKIRKTWHYLFVSIDDDSGLPVFHSLLPTRTKWACRLVLLKLKRLGMTPVTIITDGLPGYVSAIAAVFPAAKHLLCLFHQQQSVTRCVKAQFDETEQDEANAAKTQMKRIVQTHDSRTVTRRLDRLEDTAPKKGWNIIEWIADP